MNLQCRSLKYLIAVVLLAVFANGCSTTPTGRKQLTLKSDATLAAESTRAMAQLRATSALINDRATIDYVACVADAIVGTLDDEDAALYWEMAIVNNPEVNAFVMPGGKIVVKSGIMSVAKNQHQLAAVLGHEVAHVTANHANERATRSDLTGFGIEVLAAVLVGDSANYYSRNYDPNMASGIYGAAGTFGQLGLMNPFSRMQESEADDIGLIYMAKAGFDPREAVTLWQNMNSSSETAKIPEFLSTHPSGDTRIESMVAQLPEALALYNEAQANGLNPNCQP
ncbi:MAG: M48 family metallopeptidase [Woeseiaceae bacterium]